jgi:polyisoprenoid-binding protein YceI
MHGSTLNNNEIQIIKKLINQKTEIMKISFNLTALLFFAIIGINTASAQKYLTKTGNIKFFSETPMEKIEANNNQVNAAMDSQTGDLVFKVLIMSFQFEKALMQEHFNENYMESEKYPNAIFKGKITNLSSIDFKKEGTYEATIEGDLTIHNVTNKISEKGTITIKPGEKIGGYSKFNIKPADYDIKIPGAVIKNIAEFIEVTVDIELSKMQ